MCDVTHSRYYSTILGYSIYQVYFDMLLHLGASTRNVRWPKKSLIGIKNPYSDKASFFLVKTSISTISRLQIDLSLFYPNAENGEIRYKLYGETPTNVLLIGESVFGHVVTAFSLHRYGRLSVSKVYFI